MDPVRAALVVAGGPARMREVVGWLRSAEAGAMGLAVCRIKNGFALPEEVAKHYIDIYIYISVGVGVGM
jgi:hypothetical protein